MKEAMTYVLLHSAAKNISLKLVEKNKQLRIHLIDDGIKLDYTNIHKTTGLENIKARALKGDVALNIDSQKGIGTCIEICIPSLSN
jgi:signal transduction histidine kinase